MSDLLSQSFVLNALIVSTILGLLLSYLGVHVVGRGIVFVDLALGQISMLGVAFAGYIGGGGRNHDLDCLHHGWGFLAILYQGQRQAFEA